MLATYARATLTWALAGGVLVLGMLALSLGSIGRVLQVATPIGGALVVTLAVLTGAGRGADPVPPGVPAVAGWAGN